MGVKLTWNVVYQAKMTDSAGGDGMISYVLLNCWQPWWLCPCPMTQLHIFMHHCSVDFVWLDKQFFAYIYRSSWHPDARWMALWGTVIVLQSFLFIQLMWLFELVWTLLPLPRWRLCTMQSMLLICHCRHSVCRITANVISRFHWNLALLLCLQIRRICVLLVVMWSWIRNPDLSSTSLTVAE